MTHNQHTRTDVWEKWDWLWQALFYIAILLSFGFALQDDTLTQSLWQISILTGSLFVWHWGGMVVAYRDLSAWDEHIIPRLVIIIGDIALWFLLVTLSSTFYIALFGLFIQVFRHLPVRVGSLVAIGLTIVMVTEQWLDTGNTINITNANSWLFILATLASIGLGIWINAIINQSTQRRELIAQLEVTQKELVESERRAGVLEERQRLAREIHDTLAQGFTSIVMHLEAAEQALPSDINTLQRHLDQARSTARTSLDQARRVVQDLRPDLLEGHSLASAIQRTTQRWQEETNILAHAHITGDLLPLPSTIEITLLRATQESLNNIRKHAQANDVRVTLSYMRDMIMLDIQDDGVGLAQAQPTDLSGGYGLQAMRERVQQCGGTVIVESEPDDGTTVVISIPLNHSIGQNKT